jgi:hypothetical protein
LSPAGRRQSIPKASPSIASETETVETVETGF